MKISTFPQSIFNLVNHRTFKWQALCVILFALTACTKIETTTLGRDLIPVVDNVNTFDTILTVVANNNIDDLEYRLNSSNPHMVGAISEDAIFGTSKASLFFEMKPTFFPFTFAHYDSIRGSSKVGFDSAVLILSYSGYYGDSLEPVNLKLYEVNKEMIADSSVTPSYTLNPDLAPNTSKLWGSKTVSALQFKDSLTIIRKDTTKVINQLRIRLDDNLARQLFFADTLTVYKSDTTFKQRLPGFALVADGSAKTLLYFNLGDASKIEFFFRANPNTTAIDTTSGSFSFTGKSGHAVKFENNRSGAEINNYLVKDPVNGTDNIYLQSAPGTNATLHFNGLDIFKQTNKIIHRAELRVTQSGPAINNQLTAPRGLYLDVIDTTADLTYKGLPYDLNPFGVYYCYPASGIDFSYFGGLTSTETVNGNNLAVYRFNISRYIQAVVTRNEPIYDFRLSAPFYTFYKDCANPNSSYPQQVFPFALGGNLLDPPGMGRLKIAGGSNAVNQNVRMQLRIIYSKL